ncbi:DUF6463 family protein [Luteipulveratus halotolerans]|uniref:Uncharacterized protein n=1 Tax=Luteipulveratus halotolerans TaxID=1631356 RepID=A0A0L6CGG0_9MICO|nr:DUF6463 family protein [Luteipulveratus halotolerans]KNX36608.1 hypothetical protein VV01_04675 [Luteipulveratus halotolerans]
MTRSPARTPWTAVSLGVIGAAHLALTVHKYRDQVHEIVREGVLDRVERTSDGTTVGARPEAFWFATCGIATLALAGLTGAAERSPAGPPRALAPMLAGLATWGVALMPRSGFWSFYGAAALAHRARR